MKAIIVTFDSLNRCYLPPYGGGLASLPNFQRLAERTVTFDRSYVCSMPCMPARRDFHTGRPSYFLRNWGPLEPFDESFPELLKTVGVSTHLVTDHYHYFEDGGATYHSRYSTWQGFRGQEGDPWMGQVGEIEIPKNINGKGSRKDWVNRQFIKDEKAFPQVQTFDAGLDFIERNHAEDSWMLHIETFDPHEPFVSPESSAAAEGDVIFDWPAYAGVTESEGDVCKLRANYSSLLSLCDKQLGRVLDAMDRHGMWEDTMLIVWTDHGFLLGEHRLWAKNHPEMWEEISHTPFFVWDPRSGKCGERREALVQPALDLAPTLLSYFSQSVPESMTGCDLGETVCSDASVRDVALFSYHDMPLHITDGRYVSIRYAEAGDYDIYTLMPTSMRQRWGAEELAGAQVVEELPFAKGFPVMKILRRGCVFENTGPLLFDLKKDPAQLCPISDSEITSRLFKLAEAELRRCEAPREYFLRYGFHL
ncbi:MAG: sulfatase [Chthoniobacterales bacterium]